MIGKENEYLEKQKMVNSNQYNYFNLYGLDVSKLPVATDLSKIFFTRLNLSFSNFILSCSVV